MKNLNILNKLERILSDGKNILMAGGAAILLTLGGCSAIKTNTLPMNQEPFANSIMQGTKIDEINTNQGKYFAIKIPEDKTVTLNDSLFDKNVILDFYLIPYNNSEEIRDNKVLRINSEEKYALINIDFNTHNNKVELNRDAYRKQTKMILEERTLDSLENPEIDPNKIISERKIPEISQKLGMININHQEYFFAISEERINDPVNNRPVKKLEFALVPGNDYAPFKKTIRTPNYTFEELGLKYCYQYAPIRIDCLADVPKPDTLQVDNANSIGTPQNPTPNVIKTTN